MSNDKMRSEFEAKWPVPKNCIWTGHGYAVEKYNAWDAARYCDKWDGWKAAIAGPDAEIARLTADRRILQATAEHPAPCARHCESQAYEIELRRLRGDVVGMSASLVRAQGDAARLDFMITHGAWIAWSKDCEKCRVFHHSDEGESAPIMGLVNNAWHYTAIAAIDAAIKGRS